MIHFYFGEDDFAIHRQISSVSKKFAEEYGHENISRIDGGEIDAQNLLAEIVNINLFAANKLIILNDLSKNKAAWDLLGDNLSRVPDETELVIIESKPDKRTKTFRALKKNCSTKEFTPPKDHEINNFVKREAADQRVEIKPDAVGELIVYTGGDRWRIANEIAKFRALNKLVTAQLVREYVEPELAANAFKLLEDLLAGRRDAALGELEKLRQLEDANRFMGLLASQVFALSAAVNAGDRSSAEVASDMGIHPFVMQKMFVVARKMSPRDVKRIAKTIAETDAKIKSTGTDPWILVELTLARI